MLRTLVAVAVLGVLFSQQIAAAAEREDWLPTSSTWTGKAHAKDVKGVEHDRGGFTLKVHSRDEDRFAATLSTVREDNSPASKVEVEGTISSTYRLNLTVTKVTQGNPPNGFLDARFTGRIVDEGKRLELRASHPSGSYVEIELTRDVSPKK